jgi:hypothetical protein
MNARSAIPAEDFVAMLAEIWQELLRGDAAFTFVIDPGGSGWGPTLASLSAAQASRAMPSGTTIAAHTAHAAAYLEFFEGVIRNQPPSIDWPATFHPAAVDDDGWRTLQQRLQDAAARVAALMQGNPAWQPLHVRGAVANLAHLAYHLGAIRQLRRLLTEDHPTP